MLRTRVIPVLLLQDGGLVKTVKFKDPKYVGDPINAVRIFNEKEVDELIILNISRSGTTVPVQEIRDIASEAFMPMGYGGGIRSMEDVYKVFQSGFEKVILNTGIWESPDLVKRAVSEAGGQSVVACLDVRKNILGKYQVYINNGSNSLGTSPVYEAKRLEQVGIGEIIIQSIDRDGTQSGYDVKLITEVASAVQIPVVACGGAKDLSDFAGAVKAGASAVAAGSCFVFYGKHRAVLISYPDYSTLEAALDSI